MRSVTRLSLVAAIALVPAVAMSPAYAAKKKASVSRVLTINDKMIAVSQASQARVDELVDQRNDLVSDYKSVLKEIDGLEVYNAQLDRQISNQEKEMAQLNSSLDRVTIIDRQMTPLMIRMIDGLEQFVKLDVPFLPKERSERLSNLNELMERSDVSTAEKFRNVIEAYKVENDYGRTIEAYVEELEVKGTVREVDVLRVGRVALMYQTQDRETTGMWNIQEKQWEELGSEYKNPVRNGIRVARKQTAPELLRIPLNAPEVAK